MVFIVILIAWLAIGAVVGVVDSRHGHWRHSWVVSTILGPFALALAWEHRRLEPPSATVLTTGRARRGPVDVLIGFDGSTVRRVRWTRPFLPSDCSGLGSAG